MRISSWHQMYVIKYRQELRVDGEQEDKSSGKFFF